MVISKIISNIENQVITKIPVTCIKHDPEVYSSEYFQ